VSQFGSPWVQIGLG